MPGFPFKEIIQSQTPDRLRTNITFRMKVDALPTLITHINPWPQTFTVTPSY